jgi:ribonucleoside-triphosphate reductase
MKTKCEIYSRVCGFLRPVEQWNVGKVEEFHGRKTFLIGERETLPTI